MSGPHRGEVTMIERRQFRLPEPLDQCKYRPVDHPDRKVVIGLLDLLAALEVRVSWTLDPVGAAEKVVQECQPDGRRQSLMAPIVELRKHQCRNDQILLRPEDEVGTANVVRICRVDACQENAGIKDQRQLLRRCGDRVGRRLRGGGTVGRPSQSQARPTGGKDRASLLGNGLGEHIAQALTPAPRLVLQDGE